MAEEALHRPSPQFVLSTIMPLVRFASLIETLAAQRASVAVVVRQAQEREFRVSIAPPLDFVEPIGRLESGLDRLFDDQQRGGYKPTSFPRGCKCLLGESLTIGR